MVVVLIGELRSVAYCCRVIAPCTDYYYDDETTARALQNQNAQSGRSGRICKLSISELVTASQIAVNNSFQVNLISRISWILVTFAYQFRLANKNSVPVLSTLHEQYGHPPPSRSPGPRLCTETYRHVRRSAVDGHSLWTSILRADMADMVLMIQSAVVKVYPCLQTFTAETTRIAASAGRSNALATTSSNLPPINVPRIEPAAMTSRNMRFRPRTEKLWSRL
jgi:hypothetical protein